VVPGSVESTPEELGAARLLDLQPALQGRPPLGRVTGRVVQGAAHGGVHIPADGIHGLGECLGRVRTVWNGAHQLHRGVPLPVQGLADRSPRRLLLFAHRLLGFGADGVQFLLRGRPLHHEEPTELTDAIEFFRPGQPLRRLVALVRPAGAVPLRLGALLHVDEHGHMALPTDADRPLVGQQEGRIVPGAHLQDDDAPTGQLRFGFGERNATIPGSAGLRPVGHAGQGLRNALPGRLEFLGDRNAVAIVPYAHAQRDTKDSRRVDRFPKHPLRRRGVPDGAEGDLIAALREALGLEPGLLHLLAEGTVMLARVGQAQQAGHLARGRRQVDGTVGLLGVVQKMAIRAHRGRSEMAVHLTACRHGLAGGVGVGVELSEILLDGQQADRHHQRLVPIVSTAEITGLELAGEGQLGHLLAVSEDAELGFAGQDLFPTQKRRFPADAGQSVIMEGHLAEVIPGFERESCSHG